MRLRNGGNVEKSTRNQSTDITDITTEVHDTTIRTMTRMVTGQRDPDIQEKTIHQIAGIGTSIIVGAEARKTEIQTTNPLPPNLDSVN